MSARDPRESRKMLEALAAASRATVSRGRGHSEESLEAMKARISRGQDASEMPGYSEMLASRLIAGNQPKRSGMPMGPTLTEARASTGGRGFSGIQRGPAFDEVMAREGAGDKKRSADRSARPAVSAASEASVARPYSGAPAASAARASSASESSRAAPGGRGLRASHEKKRDYDGGPERDLERSIEEEYVGEGEEGLLRERGERGERVHRERRIRGTHSHSHSDRLRDSRHGHSHIEEEETPPPAEIDISKLDLSKVNLNTLFSVDDRSRGRETSRTAPRPAQRSAARIRPEETEVSERSQRPGRQYTPMAEERIPQKVSSSARSGAPGGERAPSGEVRAPRGKPASSGERILSGERKVRSDVHHVHHEVHPDEHSEMDFVPKKEKTPSKKAPPALPDHIVNPKEVALRRNIFNENIAMLAKPNENEIDEDDLKKMVDDCCIIISNSEELPEEAEGKEKLESTQVNVILDNSLDAMISQSMNGYNPALMFCLETNFKKSEAMAQEWTEQEASIYCRTTLSYLINKFKKIRNEKPFVEDFIPDENQQYLFPQFFRDPTKIPTIYVPNLEIFRANQENQYCLMKNVLFPNISIILVTPFDLRKEEGDLTRNSFELSGENRHIRYKEFTKNKIRAFLRVAKGQGHDSVVIPDFGAKYHNYPEYIAIYFEEVLKEPEFWHMFKQITFAFDKNDPNQANNYKIYHARLHQLQKRLAPKPAKVPEAPKEAAKKEQPKGKKAEPAKDAKGVKAAKVIVDKEGEALARQISELQAQFAALQRKEESSAASAAAEEPEEIAENEGDAEPVKPEVAEDEGDAELEDGAESEHDTMLKLM